MMVDVPFKNSGNPLGVGHQHVRLPGTSDSVVRRLDDKNADTISVKDFGANPSKSASFNRGAIQDALDYIGDLGGGTVLVPPGTYACDGGLVYPDQAGVRLIGGSKASAGGLVAGGSSVLTFSQNDGAPSVRLRASNQVLADLILRGVGDRDTGNAGNSGVEIEPEDAVNAGARGCLVSGVTVRDHAGRGVFTSGNVNHTLIERTTIRACLHSGFQLDDGTINGMTNKSRPGQISIIDCRTFDIGGHALLARAPGNDTGVYRLYVMNLEAGSYTSSNYDDTIFIEDSVVYIEGENVIVEGSAFGGGVDGTPTIGGITVLGKVIRLRGNRYILNDPWGVKVGQNANHPTIDVVIDGMLIDQQSTLDPAVQIETGAKEITLVRPDSDRITNFLGGDDSFTWLYRNGISQYSREIRARTFKNVFSDTQDALELRRVDSAVGVFLNRTGTGASTVRLLASGGGATLNSSGDIILNHSGTVNVGTLPTSASGLNSGDLWNDGGTVKVVT